MPRKQTYSVLINVPIGVNVPEFYSTANPEDAVTALQLGANLFSTMQSMRLQETDASIAALEERKVQEIARIQETASTAQEKLQHEIQTLRATKEQELERLYASHSQAVEDVKSAATRSAKLTYESQVHSLEEQINGLQQRLQQLDENRQRDIKLAETRTQALMNLVLEEKQRSVDRLERERDKLTTIVEQNNMELRHLSSTIQSKKAQSTREKGADFEQEFRERLLTAYGTGPGFALQTTASSGFGHAGDHVMNWDGKTILWEVKNYDKPVPTHEVDKFLRDMTENPTISIGVMVSRTTYITGKHGSGNKCIEFLNDRMLIYLSHFDAMAESTLHDMMLLFKMYWHASRNFESQESIESAVRLLEKLHSEAATARTGWRLHKSRNDEMVRWMAEQLESAEERLQSALRALQGMSTSAPLEIPLGIFRDVEGEPKAREWIRAILEASVVEPGSACTLNDIASAIAEKFNITRDTMRSHVRSVLLDSSIQTVKGKPIRVLGLRLKQASVLA